MKPKFRHYQIETKAKQIIKLSATNQTRAAYKFCKMFDAKLNEISKIKRI